MAGDTFPSISPKPRLASGRLGILISKRAHQRETANAWHSFEKYTSGINARAQQSPTKCGGGATGRTIPQIARDCCPRTPIYLASDTHIYRKDREDPSGISGSVATVALLHEITHRAHSHGMYPAVVLWRMARADPFGRFARDPCRMFRRCLGHPW